MKKLILALLAVTSFSAANAQEGTWLLYGNAGFTHDKTELSVPGADQDYTSYNINPGFGYQFSKNMTVGIQGGYMGYSSDQFDTSGIKMTQKMSGWNAGAFLRYTHYFNKTFWLYGQLNAGYLSGEVESETTVPLLGKFTISDPYSGFQVGVMPALAINVHNGLALNFSFGGISYSTTKTDLTKVTNSTFDFNFGQQVNFGISKNFGCGKKGGKTTGDQMRKRQMEDSDDDE